MLQPSDIVRSARRIGLQVIEYSYFMRAIALVDGGICKYTGSKDFTIIDSRLIDQD